MEVVEIVKAIESLEYTILSVGVGIMTQLFLIAVFLGVRKSY